MATVLILLVFCGLTVTLSSETEIFRYLLQESSFKSLVVIGDADDRMRNEISEIWSDIDIQVIFGGHEIANLGHYFNSGGRVIVVSQPNRDLVNDILMKAGSATLVSNVWFVMHQNQSSVEDTMAEYNSKAMDARNRLGVNTQLFFLTSGLDATEIHVTSVIGQAFIEPKLYVGLQNVQQVECL